MKDYVNDRWREILRHNGLLSFEALWHKDANAWHEAPNARRGGWSGVVRMAMKLPQGGEAWVFIKRQENHTYRGLRHAFLPSPTFEREFYNIQRFKRLCVPSLESVYFAKRTVVGARRAILVTESLEGYLPLDALCYTPISQIDLPHRLRLIQAVSRTVRALHVHRLQHGSLYAKHFFIRQGLDAVDVKLIDLEKVRRRLTCRAAEVRDFYGFHKRLEGWGMKDQLRLFKACRGEAKLSATSRVMLREIAHRMGV